MNFERSPLSDDPPSDKNLANTPHQGIRRRTLALMTGGDRLLSGYTSPDQRCAVHEFTHVFIA